VVHCLGSCVDEDGEVSCVLFLNIYLYVSNAYVGHCENLKTMFFFLVW
jgi:hypothetical protein